MDVARLAQTHKGHRTWAFSQADFAVWKHYRSKGICAGLSAEWIKCHAEDGSLVNSLGGGGVGPLNVGKLREIAQMHVEASSHGNQRGNIDMWLQKHKIVSLKTSKSTNPYIDRLKRNVVQAHNMPVSASSSAVGCPNIENEIVDAMRKLNSCYARMSFDGTAFGTTAGHAVAVWLGTASWRGDGDAVFFDPNHGEYWFENRGDFFRFFAEFFRGVYRSFPYYFAQGWELLPCAKRVN